jgi:hypothetical protein
MANQEEKKPGEDEDNKPNETMLEEQRDPDEAVFAEEAIVSYATEALKIFEDGVDQALSSVAGFLSSENSEHAFDDRGFLEQLGSSFLDQMMDLMGGRDTPIAQAAFEMLDGQIDMAARGSDALTFIDEIKTAAREVTWNLRDNLQSVLSNQWDELRDLAYEGSTDFVAALHAFGMPEADFRQQQLSEPMVQSSQQFLAQQPKKKEEAIDQDKLAAVEEEEEKQEADGMDMALEEEEQKAV